MNAYLIGLGIEFGYNEWTKAIDGSVLTGLDLLASMLISVHCGDDLDIVLEQTSIIPSTNDLAH